MESMIMPDTHKTILIVEDEKPMQKALRLRLSADGFTVLTADDGESGLATALEKKPDLIMMDILLPKKNGMDVLRALRSDEWGNKVPVILLTALEADDHITKQVMDHRPTFYLVKSEWRLEQVSNKVKEALGLR